MTNPSTVHARVVTHPRAAGRSPVGLRMIIIMMLAMVPAMFLLMG